MCVFVCVRLCMYVYVHIFPNKSHITPPIPIPIPIPRCVLSFFQRNPFTQEECLKWAERIEPEDWEEAVVQMLSTQTTLQLKIEEVRRGREGERGRERREREREGERGIEREREGERGRKIILAHHPTLSSPLSLFLPPPPFSLSSSRKN